MNALDILIVIVFIGYMVSRRQAGFTHTLFCACGAFTGYIVGLLLSAKFFSNNSSDFRIGIYSLLTMLGLAALGGLLLRYVSMKMRMKIILSPYYKADRLAGLPLGAIVGTVGIIILSQTLIYIPIVSLQYETQGSSILMLTDKLIPANSLEKYAARISPEQVKRIALPYRLPTISKINLSSAPGFEIAATQIADSIVRISGVGCTGRAYGSGFVAANGLVITNEHVIAGSSSLYMTNQRGSYPATPILIDKDYDIAVLYSKFLNAPAISLSSNEPIAGMSAASMGYPRGGSLQITAGEVSKHSFTSAKRKLGPTNTFQLNATLGPGSSGGPVINTSGEVIGINDSSSGSSLIAIRASLAAEDLKKANNKYIPSKTGLCDIPPKFY